MSRSGYSDDCDHLDLYRQAVERAIQGKRGQALLKELEAALLALPEKKLCDYDFANTQENSVCALGAVALKRKIDAGMDRLKALADIEKEYPQGTDAERAAHHFDIADSLAREITYVNDEQITLYNFTPTHPGEDLEKGRYDHVLKWVQANIKR